MLTPTVRETILAVLAERDDPLGATHADLVEATGAKPKAVTRVLQSLKVAGLAFSHGRNLCSRYFATAQQLADALPAIAADRAARLVECKAMQNGKRRYASPEAIEARKERDRIRSRLKRKTEPKPPKVAAPKHKQRSMTINPTKNATAKPPKKTTVNWKDQPAIVPAHVHVQHIPGYTGVSRYRADIGFVGPFLRAGVGRYEPDSQESHASSHPAGSNQQV